MPTTRSRSKRSQAGTSTADAAATPSSAVSDGILAFDYSHGLAGVVYDHQGHGQSLGPRQPLHERVLVVLRKMFLPEDYPASVSADYLAFQLWDTGQALTSYVRGLLTSQAILRGVGVGQQAATPLAAVFLFFVRDLAGMLGGILFAFWQGSSFDTCAKQWRIFADVINDIGMAVELASPLFPQAFLLMACFGSISRSITGVAGGATRAALTSHFALRGNAADVSAKETSQETATTLIGMVLGMVFTRLTAGHTAAAWVLFVLLTILHVWANVKALRCLVLRSLNTPRLEVLVSHFLTHGSVPAPQELAAQESLVPPPFKPLQAWLPQWCHPCRVGLVRFGCSIQQLCATAHLRPAQLAQLVQDASTHQQPYLITPARHHTVAVATHRDFTSSDDLLRAYTHALVLTAQGSQSITTTQSDAVAAGQQVPGRSTKGTKAARIASHDPATAAHRLAWSQDWMKHQYAAFIQACEEAGWDLQHVLLKSPINLVSYQVAASKQE